MTHGMPKGLEKIQKERYTSGPPANVEAKHIINHKVYGGVVMTRWIPKNPAVWIKHFVDNRLVVRRHTKAEHADALLRRQARDNAVREPLLLSREEYDQATKGEKSDGRRYPPADDADWIDV